LGLTRTTGSGCSRSESGSPALSVIQGHHLARRSSFSRGFSVVPDRRRAVFIGIAGEPKFRASFDREGSATCLGRARCREIIAYTSGARHTANCAESGRTRYVTWPSLARTGRPGFQARWAGRGGRDHRQVHLPRAVAGRDRTNSCSVPERDVLLHGEFLLIPASGKLVSRQHRPSQAKVGFTIQRRGSTSNPGFVRSKT